MSDVIIITWTTDKIELRQVPSEGIWQPPLQAIRECELNRPTRSERISKSDSGGGLHLALSSLFSDIEINLPIWFLLPREWVQTFTVDNPNLKSVEMTRAQIIWEAQQRISGDISRFKVLLPTDLEAPKLTFHMVRMEIIDIYVGATGQAGIEMAGIISEPEWGEPYNFEMPLDLRESVGIDTIDSSEVRPSVSIPPVLLIVLAVAALAVASYIWILPLSRKPVEVTPDSLAIAQVADTGIAAAPVTDITVEIAAEKEDKRGIFGFLFGKKKKKEEPAELKPITATGAPVNQIAGLLPADAEIKLAVFSPVDARLEITGLNDPNTWLKEIKKSTVCKSAKLAGSYKSKGETIYVIEMGQPEWNPGERVKDFSGWSKLASSKGLKPKGRSARGDLASAQALIDEIWSSKAGYEKILLAPDKDKWVVTVQ
ncbi:hypothetical protein HQ587_07845 [bacterium]|nr:hypothetical protein [bacterium]